MSTPVTWNGTTYNIPAAGELNWSSLSNFLIALGNNAAIAGGAVTYGSRVVTTTPDTVGPTDTVILNQVSAPSVINLPTTVGNSGRILVIVDSFNSARTSSRPITITAFSGNLINGSATYVIDSDGGAVILVGASNSWKVLASYEGSQILNSRTTATSANTASAIVARDASGNFTAGTITAALTGNASTATSATTAANLSGSNLSGSVTNVGNAVTIASGVITNAMVNVSASIADTKLATISTSGKVSNSATTATSSNTLNTIVARDASGNFTATTITADLSGNATTATTATSATTATTATSAANLTGSNLTGDVTNVANAMTITAGTITNAMVNASAGIVDTKLATISTAGKVSNSATTATNANTVSTIVARNGSGDFAAGAVTVSKLVDTGPITLSQIATPTAPGASLTNVYAKTDGKIYRQTSDGEFGIGGGSGSGINYLTDWNDATRAVGTVSTVAAGGNVSVSGSFPNVLSAWYADATSGSAAIASSTTNALRGTTNYLTALSSASTSGATFVQTPVFNIDGTDLGKALAVQFDVTANTTANDWDVVAVRYDSAGTFGALIPIAGIASTTTGTASAQVPTGTTTFRGFFITGSTASDVYSIRWRRRAGAVAIRFDNLIVGPNSVMLGTAITDWVVDSSNFTIPTAAFGTATNVFIARNRSGDSIRVRGKFKAAAASASTAYIQLPSGFAIDFTKLPSSSEPSTIIVGCYQNISSASTAALASDLRPLFTDGSTTNQVFFAEKFNASQFVKANASNFMATATDTVSFDFILPITNFSSNVTMADRAVEEYAWNSDTTDGSTTTSGFSNGPSGVAIGLYTTAERVKRIRFQTSVQSTDLVSLEIYDGTNWVLGNSIFAYIVQSTSRYGALLTPVTGSNTDYDVLFAATGARPTGATYASAGAAWSGFTAYKWRVRKVSGGAAVGFPIAPANITLIDSADNYSGNTKLGFMKYLHGVSYNGGIAPTVTLSAGGGTLTTVNRAVFIPYQLADGIWRIKFNLNVTISSLSRTIITLAVNGITSISVSQCVTGFISGSGISPRSSLAISTNTFSAEFSATTTDQILLSGDVELNAKPTWAY